MCLANLTRYSMYAKGVSEYNSELKPNPQLGEWVKFEDVRKLLKQADNKRSTPLQQPCDSCGRILTARFYCSVCDNDE